MSIVDHNQTVIVPYNIDQTFSVLQQVVLELKGFKIERIDDVMKTFYLKAGISAFSWGENITVSLTSHFNGGTQISILSTPKTGVMFGGAVDMGKNRKNITTLLNAISDELQKLPKEIDVTFDKVNFCSNCGTKLDSSDNFCFNCGNKIY